MIEITHVTAPLVDEVWRRDEIKDAVSLNDYLRRAGITLSGPVVAVRIFDDAEPIPITTAYWDAPLEASACVRLVYLPQGGGDGGSKPALVIASIALAATGMGAPIAAGIAGTWGGAALSAGIMVGGSLLINAIFAPNVATPITDSSRGSSLETRSIATGGRIPTIDTPIPVAFGKNSWRPPRASHDWVEYVEDHPQRPADQYAHVLLCLGVGEHALDKIEIGGTNITNLEGVTSQLVPPGGTITLAGYHDNIYTSPMVGGAELPKYGLRYFESELYSGIFPDSPSLFTPSFPSDPELDGFCYVFTHRYDADPLYPFKDFRLNDAVTLSWPGGSCNLMVQCTAHAYGEYCDELLVFQNTVWPNLPPDNAIMMVTEYTLDDRILVGPYAVCKAGQAVDQIGIDLVHPGGLYYAEDDGSQSFVATEYRVDIQAIDALGTPVGAVSTLATISYNERTASPLRRTHEFAVSPGCYQVWMSRPVEVASTRTIDRVQWVGLKGRLPAKMTYAKVTVLALRIKAGTFLNGAALNDIKVASTRKLPTHTGTAWTAPVATRGIAWAVADLSRNGDYSIGLPDDRLDISGLRTLDATWAARGDTCDGVLTTASTYWKSLSMMARCGRAIPQVPGGIITLMRDQPTAIKKAAFHVRNIKRGSFSIEYILYEEDSPDDVLVKYTDAETGEAEEVQCNLPEADGIAPAEFPMWGIGHYPQARREGLFEAACNMYRRTLASFTAVNYSGRPLRRGWPVSVSHPLPDWGVSGEVLAVTGRTLTLSEPPIWKEGAAHYIQLSQSNGRPDGPWSVTPGPTDVEVIMAIDPPAFIYTGLNHLRTPFQFGPGDDFEAVCLIVSATPRGSDVAIVCAVGDPRVHTAEEG